MCGRYRLSRRKQIVEEYFDTASGDRDWDPRYNIASIVEKFREKYGAKDVKTVLFEIRCGGCG
jgi:putative SOS response-associated peptidase YedK